MAGGVVRVRGFEWSAVHLAAAVPVMLPAVLAEELWARLGLVSGLTLALRRGVVAAVPAAELPAIMAAQWQGPVGWVIGPPALVSWEAAYPGRDFRSGLSSEGADQLQAMLAG